MNVRALGERFVWGLLRPVRLILGLRANPAALKVAVRSALIQVAATLVLTAGVMAYRADELFNAPEKARGEAKTSAFRTDVSVRTEVDVAGDEREVEQAAKMLDEQGAKLPPAPRQAMQQLASQLRDEVKEERANTPAPATDAKSADDDAEEQVATALEKAAEVVDRVEREGMRGAPTPELARQVSSQMRDQAKRARAKEQTSTPEDADDDEEETPPIPIWKQFWAAALSALFAAQWVVLALSRDYQERTSRALALTAGLEPEEDDKPPKVRVDWKWLRRKLRRRIRGVLVLVPGFLVASPVLLFAKAAGWDWLISGLTALWTFYWWTVFSAARTARAWAWESSAGANAPLRGWIRLTEQVRGFRWWGPRLVTWVWVRTTRSMFSPAKAVELDPGAFVGLSVARLIGNLPLIRVIVRPAMSVVAAEIVVMHELRAPALSEAHNVISEPSQHAKDQAGV